MAKWPPTKAEVQRLQEIEKKYNKLHDHQLLQPFMDEFANNFLTLANSVEMGKWSSWAVMAFDATKARYPSLAELYVQTHKEQFAKKSDDKASSGS